MLPSLSYVSLPSSSVTGWPATTPAAIVYDAGGTANRGICSADLAKLLPCEKVILIDSLDAAYTWCLLHRVEFGAFVTCGARDPGLPALARRLGEM